MSVTWQYHECTREELDAIAEQDRRDSFAFTKALIFALLCSAPFWALVIHEFRKGILR